jgi:hypothetical protein
MWLIIPPMLSPSAPEQQALNSDSSWLYPELERSVTLNGTHLPAQSWQDVCETASWMKPLSGRILRPSEAQNGVERWISSLRDGHASRSAPWVKALGKRMKGTSGHLSETSSETSTPSASSEKTSPTTSRSDSTRSKTTYEEWAIATKRESSLRRKWAERILGTDCSYWPTLRASMPDCGNSNRYGEKRLEDVMVGWVVRRLQAKGKDLTEHIRPLGREASCGDGSPRMILYLNLRFLHGLMQWPQGWASPVKPIEISKYEQWEMESSLRVRHMLSWYFSEGHLAVSRDLSKKKQQKTKLKTNPKSSSNCDMETPFTAERT